jgi:hypothetical protein
MKAKELNRAPGLAKPMPAPSETAKVIRFPVEFVKQQPAETQLVPCCYCHADRWCVRLSK